MDKEEEVIGLRLVSIALSREADFDNGEEHFCVDKGEVKKEDDRSEVDQLVTLELAGRFNSNLLFCVSKFPPLNCYFLYE